MLMWMLLFGLLVLCVVYWALGLNYKYWKKRGVPNPPVSTLFGNLGPSLSLAKSIGEIYNEIYNAYPELLYVGYYKIRQPGIVLRDPGLIKDVLVKEFSSFHDNEFIFDEKVDPIGGKNPFALRGERWKIVRNQITPCFTSKKIKAMYPLLEAAVKKMLSYLEREPEATGQNGLDTKELCAKYATDVVATCAFGLEGKSFDEPDPEFRRMGKKVFHPSFGTIIKMLLLLIFPSLARFLKVKFFSDEVVNYFRKVVTAALKYREDNKVVRNDFLDFMKELKSKPGEYDFTDDDVLAHTLGFFTDGFETSSVTMSYTFFELAANPDVQEKLLSEVLTTLEKNKGKFDYETINEMQYLDAVINESLRMHPPGMVLFRACTKPFTLPPPGGIGTGPEVKVEKDTPVIIPIYGLHYDPKYYPDPERFDPDRFTDKNQDFRPKCVYLPFGEGPRACLGQRFGMMQIKIVIARVVADFEIKVNNKTILPLEMDPAYLIPHPKGGIWLNFHKRNSTEKQAT